MKKQLERRLAQLEEEMMAGQEQIRLLDEQRIKLTNTLLRISGAIQVLKEELGQDDNPGNENNIAEENNIPIQ